MTFIELRRQFVNFTKFLCIFSKFFLFIRCCIEYFCYVTISLKKSRNKIIGETAKKYTSLILLLRAFCSTATRFAQAVKWHWYLAQSLWRGAGSNLSRTSGSLAAGRLSVALIIGKNIGILCSLSISGSFSILRLPWAGFTKTMLWGIFLICFCGIFLGTDLVFKSCLFWSFGESTSWSIRLNSDYIFIEYKPPIGLLTV